MKLTRIQFETLVDLIDSKESLPEQDGVITELISCGLLDETREITEKGLESLEIYRTKRVIFLAAGFGSRLRPATLNVPKPMVRVQGRPIICSAIDAALQAGIEEIYIVRGYLGECFEQLLSKYPQVRLIDNPDYETANNISSAMQVSHLMQNAYVMEADLLINNPSIFRKYNYTSNCQGVPVEKTDDWCVITENGVVKQLIKGGEHCHHLFSIYYMSAEDGAKLPAHLKEMYESDGGRDLFWDIAPTTRYNEHYHIEVHECSFSDISEIDTYKELQMLDPAYIVE